MIPVKNILTLDEVNKDSIPEVGGKGANLGEMYQAKFPVPNAFMVTAGAFEEFLKTAKIKDAIMIILADVDINSEESLRGASEEIKAIFMKEKMSWELEKEIAEAYEKLGGGKEDFVAVRSSATAEDLPEASFAGQQETFLNVKGKADVLEAVKKCWASLYTARAIFYRVENGFKHEDVKLCAVIQRMVNSEVAGVMFTSDPSTGEPHVLIEAAYGLGEVVVGGQVTPDTYMVDQSDLKITNKVISKQKWQLIRGKRGNLRKDVNGAAQEQQKLSDEAITDLAKAGMTIEKHYAQPMDVEWAVEQDKIYIVQARPVTTIRRTKPAEEAMPDSEAPARKKEKVLVKGLPASPGVASGKVNKIKDSTELDKIKEGDILVTVMTTPDMVPAMKRAAAIITNEGGMTCHASIVSRELGIPCIVGTGNATEILNNGDVVTVDAKLGVVYEGEHKDKVAAHKAPMPPVAATPVTGTKILLNLGVPEMAEEYSKLPVDGIGLMREEFIVTSYIGEHPLELIKNGKEKKFIDALVEGISEVARAFYPRPVVLRTSDFKTNEYRALKGGEAYETHEANPMIGWRGCSRYISDNYIEAFLLELRAIKKVRDDLGLKNVWVMLPFVRTVEELKEIVYIMEDEGLKRSKDFKLWIMAEVPSNVFMAEELAEWCDGFSIGSNDLTQLVMGADRDSEVLAKMGYFDERNDAVKRAIKQIIEGAHKKGKTVSICGQAPSVYPEFTEFLIRNGIDSISLNADVVHKTRRLVASIEQKIILERLRTLTKE